MPYYTFSQNNSGGRFIVNDKIGHYVIIEADDIESALEKSEEVGIYFDGVEDGEDCSCCGDGWYHPYDSGNLSPMIYDKSPEEGLKDNHSRAFSKMAHIYHKDGRHEVVGPFDGKDA